MSEKNPFNKPPQADRAFAYGDDPFASLQRAQDVLDESRLLHKIDSIENRHVDHEYHEPATDAALRGDGNAVSNLNMLKIPEARNNVANKQTFLDIELDKLYPIVTVAEKAVKDDKPRNSIAVETQRQSGIDAADRANRAASGLAPRVFNLK